MSATADEKTRISGDSPGAEKTSESGNGNGPLLPTTTQDAEKTQPPKPTLHPAFYVATWISLSSSVILYNKWILDTLKFHYPVILTTYHLAFATVMTQILARYTSLLDGRKSVKMTGRVYLRAIVPIGLCFSLSLICGNLTYLYLSVAFIQMLKATTPVAVLLSSWAMGLQQPSLKVLANVSAIVIGVILASVGEINFVLIGFLYQCGGIIFEALRLTMVQRLLSSAEYKMDPLVSLYYFAPVCAVMNGIVALFWEFPKISMDEVYAVGFSNFFFERHGGIPPQCLRRVLDWQDVFSGPHPLWRPQGYHACRGFHAYLGNPGILPSVLRLQHCSLWYGVLQAWIRRHQGLCSRGPAPMVRVWRPPTRYAQGIRCGCRRVRLHTLLDQPGTPNWCRYHAGYGSLMKRGKHQGLKFDVA